MEENKSGEKQDVSDENIKNNSNEQIGNNSNDKYLNSQNKVRKNYNFSKN